MIKGIINTEDIKKADVVLLSAPYEKTASSHKGTIKGPAAVIDQLDHQIEFFDRKFKVNVNDYVKIAKQDLDLEKFSPAKTLGKIRAAADDLNKNNKFIFLLGGEHAVSIGIFESLAKKYKVKDVTILQIDAHCDLRTAYEGFNYSHASIMYNALEQIPQLKKLVQVGIRDFCEEELDYICDSVREFMETQE